MTDQERKDLYEEEEKENEAEKTELAERIARQSERMANTYEHVEEGIFRVIRGFSTFIDKFLFNRKYAKIVALLLAILMYLIVNYNDIVSVYTTPLKQARELSGVAVTAKYNTETFEISGLPETCDIVITGDGSYVTSAASSGGTAVADLSGLTEGTHEVKLKPDGFGDSVTVTIDPSSVVVTLKKKTTQQFTLSYDFIHQEQMESIYSAGEPEFDYSKVNVRASRDTLDSIAFVKALIDVAGQTSDFEQDAVLVAYDSKGQPVDVDIVPETVHVTVPVTSPSKTVPVEIQISGEVPNDMAIESITTDQQTVTIYGSEAVLSQISQIAVTLNVSTITKDSTIQRPIVLPAGVNSASINQITMKVTLAAASSRTIDDVKIMYSNNVNSFKASQPENKTTTSVIAYGTENNINAISADDIRVYVDMSNAEPGLQEFPLQVEQPSNGLVRYELTESTYQLNVLGESTESSDETGTTDANNN